MAAPVVPGYEQLEKIGAGGFAVVYKATQAAVGREVALKLLHTAIADEETERRFERECRVVGSLSWHPHIAAVLDAGSDDDGRSYLVFELLPGGSLGDRLERDGPLRWQDAVTYAIQTADAIEAAHAEDVLHRDVKPDNILLDRLGRAKLADFGIAQMRDGNQTKTGVITATLAHAAPEVLSGKRATKLSDVYLLGSTLFELIAGEPPFGKAVGNDFFAAIQRIGTEPPPFLSSVAGIECPREVAEAVDHALRKEPADRPVSAGAFGDALRAAQRELGQTVTAMPFVDTSLQTNASEPQVVTAPQTQVREPEADTAPEAHIAQPQVSAAAATRANVQQPQAAQPQAAQPQAAQPQVAQPQVAATPRSRTQVVAPARVRTPASAPRSNAPSSAVVSSTSRSRTPLVVALVALALVAVGAFVVLGRGGGADDQSDNVPPALAATEALQTQSQQGFDSPNVIDGDLATGWLSPNNPDGHQIVIGFGQQVDLGSIVLHAGPNPEGAGPFSEARGIGPVLFEFSDGTEVEMTLDENQARQPVAFGKRTSSLGIRSVAPGEQPVAIREVEFRSGVTDN